MLEQSRSLISTLRLKKAPPEAVRNPQGQSPQTAAGRHHAFHTRRGRIIWPSPIYHSCQFHFPPWTCQIGWTMAESPARSQRSVGKESSRTRRSSQLPSVSPGSPGEPCSSQLPLPSFFLSTSALIWEAGLSRESPWGWKSRSLRTLSVRSRGLWAIHPQAGPHWVTWAGERGPTEPAASWLSTQQGPKWRTGGFLDGLRAWYIREGSQAGSQGAGFSSSTEAFVLEFLHHPAPDPLPIDSDSYPTPIHWDPFFPKWSPAILSSSMKLSKAQSSRLSLGLHSFVSCTPGMIYFWFISCDSVTQDAKLW